MSTSKTVEDISLSVEEISFWMEDISFSSDDKSFWSKDISHEIMFRGKIYLRDISFSKIAQKDTSFVIYISKLAKNLKIVDFQN